MRSVHYNALCCGCTLHAPAHVIERVESRVAAAILEEDDGLLPLSSSSVKFLTCDVCDEKDACRLEKRCETFGMVRTERTERTTKCSPEPTRREN